MMMDKSERLQTEWFKRNDDVAQEAMREACVWYQPPYYREPLKPEPEPEPLVEPSEAPISLLPSEQQKTPKARGQKIMAVAAELAGISVSDITGPGRCRQHMHARHAVLWVLVKWLRYSTPKAGRVVNRDHSSVLHAVSRTGPYIHFLELLLRRLRKDGLL